MAGLSVENLSKSFGDFIAVRDVTLEVADGEFVFLLGPSGCGKTTTLRMISGLEMPSGGRIEIGGRNVTFLRPRHRNVGMVFQDYGLYRHMTVFDNIAYPLRVRRFSRHDIARKVQAVAQTLQISGILDRRPDRLSSGQLQRVAIARMLVRDADIFLMDEPMSHLDAQLRGEMRAELRHIQKEIGVTTVFVTHDQLEAMTMADRILVMCEGEMLQFASPQEIFERPVNEFVATFVGEPQMNVYDCVLRARDGGPVADLGALCIPLRADWLEAIGLSSRIGSPFRIGIRPEYVSVSELQSGGAGPPARLEYLEPMGSESRFVLQAGDLEISARVPTLAMRHLTRAPGASFALRFDPNWIYLFDVHDGRTCAMAAASDPMFRGTAS